MPILRQSLDYLAGIRANLRERRRWSPCAGDGIRVFYGIDRFPARSEIVHGGFVKCLDLVQRFPSHFRSPNLLYLVSSALPPFFQLMIRHAKKAGAPVVLNQNGVAYPAWHGPGWEKVNELLSQAHAQADHVIYQSEFCRISAERYLEPTQGTSEVVYNPVDTTHFVPADTPIQGPLTMVCAGSHHFWYRIRTALDVLAETRQRIGDARLLLAGRYLWSEHEAQSLQEVQNYADLLGVSRALEILGSYTQAQAPDIIRRGHILLHTNYNDCCPRLVIEAMACGLPVVYSASGGVPELVGREAGIGVPAQLDWDQVHAPDALEMAKAVLRIAEHLPEYSNNARSRAVVRFDVQHWLQRHQDIFKELLQC